MLSQKQHSDSHAYWGQVSTDGFAAKLIAMLEKEKTKRRPVTTLTSIALEKSIMEILNDASVVQHSTKKAILLHLLNRDLLQALWNAEPRTATGFLGEVILRLNSTKQIRPRGSVVRESDIRYEFSIKIPKQQLKELKMVALRYDSSVARLVSVALELVAPYITHQRT